MFDGMLKFNLVARISRCATETEIKDDAPEIVGVSLVMEIGKPSW